MEEKTLYLPTEHNDRIVAFIGSPLGLLAAWLVREGLTASEALRRVRLIDHQYVQSTEQESFLQAYEDAILRKLI